MSDITPTNINQRSTPVDPRLTPIKPAGPAKPMSFNDMVQMQALVQAKKAADAGSDDDGMKALGPKYLQDMAKALSHLEGSSNQLNDFMKGVAVSNYMLEALDKAIHAISSYDGLKSYLESMKKVFLEDPTHETSYKFGSSSLMYVGLLDKLEAFKPNGNDQQQQSEKNTELCIIQNGAGAVGTIGQYSTALRDKYSKDHKNTNDAFAGIADALTAMAEEIGVLKQK